MASSTSNNGSSTFDASSLANGLFTDFAPLLALFGDEVTKQFLATSMGWGDDILLALAPIGIMTVLVSAIRVSGYPLMKSIIGRSRDSPDDEEKDILSSTSNNVREIWNGQRVVRQGGTSQTTEFVYTVRDNIKGKPFTPGIWTLQTALTKIEASPPRYQIVPFRNWGPLWKRTKDSRDLEKPSIVNNNAKDAEDAEDLVNSLEGRSPNLTLNIKAAIPSQMQLWTVTLVGAVVQAIVFIFNALAVYFYRWPRAGYVVAPYGFPLWAVGTTFISTGMCLCAHVVEACTAEWVAEPVIDQSKTQNPALAEGNGEETAQSTPRDANGNCEGDTGYRIVRLQTSMPEVNLPAYAILNDDTDPRILISRRTIFPPSSTTPESQEPESELESESKKKYTRQEEKSERMATMTMIGTALILAGFICQNLGIRQLHWSAGVAQLVSTLLLVLLRAWLRRHVGDPPPHRLRLTQGLEATQLAAHIHGFERLMIPVGFFCSPCYNAGSKTCDTCRSDIASTAFQLSSTDDLKLVPSQVEESRGADEPYPGILHMARRVLEAESLFQTSQPCSSEIEDTVTSILFVMTRLMAHFDCKTLEWTQEISFRMSRRCSKLYLSRPPAREIIAEGHLNVELQIDHSKQEIAGRQRETLRTLLSHTMYCYSRSVEKAVPTDNFLFVVGHFFCGNNDVPSRVVESLIRDRLEILSREFKITIGEWCRGPDGLLSQASASISSVNGIKTVLGMSHASTSSKANRLIPATKAVEFIVEVSGVSVLDMFALDLISNFIKHLVLTEPRSIWVRYNHLHRIYQELQDQLFDYPLIKSNHLATAAATVASVKFP